MKRFNKFIALFLVVVMTAGLLVTGVSAATEDNTSNDGIILVEDFEVGDNGTFKLVDSNEEVESERTTDGVYNVVWNGAEPVNPDYYGYAGSKGHKATLTAGVSGTPFGDSCVSHKYSTDVGQRIFLTYSLNREVYKEKMEHGATYTASVWFKQNGGGVGVVKVRNAKAGDVGAGQGDPSTEWTKVSVDFVYDSSTPNYYIQIETAKAEILNGETYYDYLVVQKKDPYRDMTNGLAQAGTVTVELSDNVDATGNDLVLKAGKTLDLNGKTLTVDSLSALKGANVIDSVGNGKLAVAEGNLMLQKDNEAMPVKVEGGYAFVNVKAQQTVKDDGVENTLYYKTRPVVGSVDLMADGVADDGLTILVRLTWTNASNGTTTTMDVPVADTLVTNIYGNSSDGTIELTVGGADGVENLKVATVIRSATGVENVSEALDYAVAQ